jgi:prepilin-type N-terminal cleavage/methylation domain-containing protein
VSTVMNGVAETSRSREAGFTLPELLVGMTIMLIVLVGGFTLLQIVTRSEPAVRTANASIQDAQIVAERIARELRMTYQVNSATANTVSVNTYLQQASTCAGAAGSTPRECRVVYSCSGTTCTRTVSELNGSGAQTATIVTGLASTNVFTYSPSAGAAKIINLTLSLQGENSDDAVTVSDGVALRNVAGVVGS